jgi:hypothetical protein
LRIGDHFVLVCTHHQVGELQRDIALWIPGTTDFATSEAFGRNHSMSGEHVTDEEDICGFGFASPVREFPEIAARFFHVNAENVLLNGNNILYMYCYGYPFSDQHFDVYEGNIIELRDRAIMLESPSPSADPCLWTARSITTFDFNPNGMSGGPVFAICSEVDGARVRFAGTICRAGNGFVHFIRSEAIMRFLVWWQAQTNEGM